MISIKSGRLELVEKDGKKYNVYIPGCCVCKKDLVEEPKIEVKLNIWCEGAQEVVYVCPDCYKTFPQCDEYGRKLGILCCNKCGEPIAFVPEEELEKAPYPITCLNCIKIE
jgi:hypothetical protein